MMNFEEHMTSEMLECLPEQEYFMNEALMCLKRAKKAARAKNIRLPATAASGLPVVHGARQVIDNIAFYWEERARLALDKLTIPNRKEVLLVAEGKEDE